MLYGSSKGLVATNNQLLAQGRNGLPDTAEAGDQFGSSLTWGNFGNGNEADLAIGVPGEDSTLTNQGAVHVVYGSPTGLTTTGSQELLGATGGEAFGSALTGANFAPGASVLSTDPRIIVVSSTYASCASLQATVTIAAGAASGPVSFDVLNLDGTTARAPSLLSIAVPPPDLTVAATLPAAGATGVATNVHPAVAFSAPVSPASVTGATVLLLGPDGAPVPQASGSPILDAAGTTVTIVPAAPLLSSTTYRLQAAGGAGGVVDLSARAMSSTFTQDPGFTTAEPTTPPPPDVTSSTPADGGKVVSLTVQPTVTFSKAMDAASVTSDTVRLLDFAGLPVLQAPGSPALDPPGMVATITLAAPLADKSWFRLQVIGGATGVRSADGAPMAQTFQQSSGFQTVNVPPGNVTNLRPQGHH